MSGYYPPNHNIPPQYYNVNPNAVPNPNLGNVPPTMTPDGSYPYAAHGLPESPVYHGIPGPFVQYGEPQMQQTYMSQYEDLSGSMDPAQGGNARMRRRTAPGDQVKHRRTRSGCYTCRQRRVKCDEAHPICERCRKGNRECVYPDLSSNQKTGRSGSKSGKSSSADEGSSPEQQDEDAKERLPAILDDEEEDLESDSAQPGKGRDAREASSDTPALTLDRSPSPSTETSSTTTAPAPRPPVSRKGSYQSAKVASSGRPAPILAKDVQFYLDYFRNHMSHHHYSLKRDAGNFLKTDFLQQTMKYEPLRYAVVGYAAYFHTLSQPGGHINTFLQYYNESVSRLRLSITKNKKQGLATFLTILQLAAIEEVLGDWVNLMGHQKAAYEMLTRLYTPQTIVQSDFLLKVLLWYIRFDLFVGFQSGGEAVLDREWYVAVHDYYSQKCRDNPDDLTLKYEERFAHSRLVAKDSSDLFSRKAKGLISDEAFMEQLPKLDERVRSLDKNIDPALLESQDKIESILGSPDPDDIVNPYEPGILWEGPRWTSNYLLLDMYGIMLMYNISISMAMRKPFDPEIVQKAYRAVQVFEAVCAYPNAPPGAIIEAQATCAIATIFLPKDAKTVNWCRRNFVKIESAGYIYSDVLRNRMLESYGVGPSDWWLPNDEGCPPIIRSIKNFIRDRTTAPKDQVSEDLREMRGIFSTLIISDSPPEGSHTPIEGTVGGAPTHVDETLIYTGGSPDYDWKYSSAEAYGSGPYSSQ
ncbi:hypothetical protein BU26DRAFT_438087 [Trematosphaeria pertusa]|uniref:Zn(2)-C6 fungal-type domain-containing protein n=1 Tax=Trematosphaeria pertusa TaxID=390896 RepID=A0A6A6HY11_9PLEO|nr:uncharacterized protein BU26DRAFT_438087 [Trematosphaeria pertusa]KAF2242931.1 hypothetical protein BU26DRAFT_438087 [Trematosphaeria pertusa]